jgi:hypothetical protein
LAPAGRPRQAAVQRLPSRLPDAPLQAKRRIQGGDRWDGQIDELDGAVAAFQTTVVGLDGDHLLGQLPKSVRDLERIDRAWTALEREIDQACPTP